MYHSTQAYINLSQYCRLTIRRYSKVRRINRLKDGSKDKSKNGSNDGSNDGSKDGLKDGSKDGSKDGPKDGPKDGLKVQGRIIRSKSLP